MVLLIQCNSGWVIKVTQEFRYPWCRQCRDSFPMRSRAYDGLEETGEAFYCPKGHALEVQRLSVVERLRSSERSVVHHRDMRDKLTRRLDATRGVQTRFKNRLLKKCCPYCNKPVDNLFKHVSERHDK